MIYRPGIIASSRSAGGWLPSDLSGIQFWQVSELAYLWQDSGMSTAVTADGDPVGAWADSSTNSHAPFLQSTTSYRPTYKTGIINGNAVLRGDGTDDYMLTAHGGGAPVDEWMLGLAFSPVTITLNDGIFSWATSPTSNSPYLLIGLSTTKVLVFIDQGYRAAFERPVIVGDHVTYVIRVTKPASNYLVDVWIDGIKATQYDAGTSMALAASAAAFFTHSAVVAPANVDIATITHHEGTYTDTDAGNLAGYLEASWG